MKSKEKKLTAILLCSAMAVGLCACGGGSSGSTAAASAPSAEQSSGQEASSGDAPQAQSGSMDTLEGWGAIVKEKSDGKKITVAMAPTLLQMHSNRWRTNL